MGEAKRDSAMLHRLRASVVDRSTDAPPDMTRTKDEARQLAWRLWTVAPDYTWLIGPNHRSAFMTNTSPLRLQPTADGQLPNAVALVGRGTSSIDDGARVASPLAPLQAQAGRSDAWPDPRSPKSTGSRKGLGRRSRVVLRIQTRR